MVGREKASVPNRPSAGFTLPRAPSKMVARPPEFGEQTDEVLAELSFTADEVASLRLKKVV